MLFGEICSLNKAPSKSQNLWTRVCPFLWNSYLIACRSSNLPYRNARVGRTSRFSSVEVINPPRITIAIGPSISRPAAPEPTAVTADIANKQARRLEIMEEAQDMIEPAAGRANGGAELES